MRIDDLSEVKEPELQPEAEYTLRIVSAKDTISQRTGREGIMLVMHNLDVDNAVPIFHRMWMPMESDPPDNAETMKRMLKELVKSLGLPVTGCDTEDFTGIEFRGLVGIEKDQNGEDRQVLRRVIEA